MATRRRNAKGSSSILGWVIGFVIVFVIASLLGIFKPSDGTSTSSPNPGNSTASPAEPDSPSSNTPVDPNATTALSVLDTLAVQGKGSGDGYERDLFGSGWLDTDNNGCDTRNDILARDLDNITLDSDGCTVLTGVLTYDPYTATTINFTRGRATSSEIQIDHVIPLSLSFKEGAQNWDDEKREAFANDPLNLIAVQGSENGSKSDQDASEWLPTSEIYHCDYVARQIAVKAKYSLWVTISEKNTMSDVLETCPNEPIPASDEVVIPS